MTFVGLLLQGPNFMQRAAAALIGHANAERIAPFGTR
jgi:hypothetical protein